METTNPRTHPHLHLECLSSKGVEVWKEAWPTIGAPMRNAIEKGLSTGERASLVPILINGHLEDRWWTYGFNPIYENGKIVGMANPGAEDTAFVKADQALRRSEEALQLTMGSAALGMWIYDPETTLYPRTTKCTGSSAHLTGTVRLITG